MKLSKALLISLGLTYIVTATHHVYGAILYDTPWRNHIVSQGLIWLIASFLFFFLYSKWDQIWSYWIFFALSIFFFFGAIGLYEGFYNHVLKNILFFFGSDQQLLAEMYPHPKYELPNDILFETTGVLTFIVSMFTGYIMFLHMKSNILKNYLNGVK